jgi:hypothetical protein
VQVLKQALGLENKQLTLEQILENYLGPEKL